MNLLTGHASPAEMLGAREAQFRDWLLERFLRFSVIAGTLLLLIWIPAAIGRGFLWQVPIFLALYGFALALVAFKHWPASVRIGGFLSLMLASGVYILAQNGLVGAGRFWLLLVPLLATLLVGRRGFWFWSLLTLGSYLLVAFAYTLGWLTPLQPQNPVDAGSWAMEALVPIAVVMVLGLTIGEYRRFLSTTMAALQSNVELAQRLQQQAQEDAQRARRQAQRLDRVVSLSRTLSRIREREKLLRHLVEELINTFGLYQANLFLVDPRGERLELVAAAGVQSEALLKEGWTLRVGDTSLPGRVAQVGTAETAIPSGDERFPLRQAEVALPLLFGGELLGVLDIYGSRKPFSEEDVRIFRVLTDQVAATLNILRLLEEASVRTQELRTLYTQMAGASWRALLEIEGGSRQVSVGNVPQATLHTLAETALADRQPQIAAFTEPFPGWLLVMPLTWRETTLGYVAFARAAQVGESTAPWDAETLRLLALATERLAAALDTVRLLRDSRRKALYQEQLARVGDVIWSSLDVETIMRHGVREVGSLLDAGEVTLVFTPPDVVSVPGTGPLPPLTQGEERA